MHEPVKAAWIQRGDCVLFEWVCDWRQNCIGKYEMTLSYSKIDESLQQSKYLLRFWSIQSKQFVLCPYTMKKIKK